MQQFNGFRMRPIWERNSRQKMTTNEQFIQMLKARGLDIRPDPRRNKDIVHVAALLHVSPIAVTNWLCPTHWKTYRKMKPVYLQFLEQLASQEPR